MAFLPGMGGTGGIGNGLIRIGADTSSIRRDVHQGMTAARQEMNRGAQQISASQKRWNAAFSAIGTAAKIGFAAVVAGAAGAVTASIQYESAIAGVAKTTGATGDELASLSKGFIELSKQMPISANELAGLGETAGALGIKTKDIQNFVRVSALLGKTTNISSDQAATALGQLSNVLNLTGADYEKFASTLVDLGNKGASTESQILDIASRAGAVGHNVGLSTDQILAFSSAVANLGIESEAGGTALQFLFQRVSLMLADKGKLADLGKTAGITGQQFKKAFLEDANGAIIELLRGLGKLDPVQQAVVLQKLGLAGARTSRTYIGLAASLDRNLIPSLETANTAWKENTAAQAAADKRFETTASQISMLKNIVVAYLIQGGDALLPAVKTFVAALRDDLPKAIEFVGDLWNNTLLPPIREAAGAFGELAAAVGEAFGDEGKPASFGDVLKTALTGIASAAASAVKMITPLIRLFAVLVDNPIGQWAVRLTAIIVGLRVAFGLFNQTVGRVAGTAGRIGRNLVGGLGEGLLGRRPGTGAPASPLDHSATMLDGSAKALTEAAASIKGASAAAGARSIEQAAAGGINYLPHGAGSRMAGTSLFAASGQYLAVGTDAASKATYLGSRRAMEATMAGKGIVTRTAAAVMDGVATAGRGLKSGMARIGSSAMSGLRLASRAFWPLLIADMGLELVKAPIGDFVAQNTQFKRAGAKIKEDFFGGMFALLQSAKIGTDAWVGREATMQVGSAKISTMALAKLGITNATFDKLEAPVGTIEHAQGTQEAATQLSQTLGQQAGETVQDWWVRVRDALPTELSKQIKQILSKPGSMTQVGTTQLYGQNTPIYDLTPEARAQIQQLMGGAVTGQVTQLTEDTKNEYVTALTAALKAQGLTTGQIAGLSTEQLTVLGRLVEGDAEGKYSALVGYVASTFTGAIQKSGKQISASKDVQSTLDTVKETLGKDWVKQMNSVLTGAPKGKHEKEVARLLAKALGSDWQDRIRQASQALVGSPTARQTPTEQLASGLAESRKNVEAAIRDYLKNIPLDYQRAVNEIIAKGKELDPGIVRKLKKKFGDDWLAGMRAGTDAIGSGPKDQAVRQALKKAFGTNWRQVLQQAGTLAFERAGGADSEMLAKALRKTLRAAVDQLTPKDLGTSGRSETRKTKAAIKKELADPVVQAALEAATGPDAKKAKKGLSDLGQAFKDTIPDAAARERFVATLVALQKAGTAPNIDDMTKFLDQAIPNAASAIVTLADGVQTLTNRVKTFLSTVGQPSGGGGSGRRGSVTVPHQARRGASGLMFDTNGQTDLTVGEAGKESVMVLRNFRHMRLNTTPVRKMVESVAAGVGGALPRPNVSRMLHAGPLAGEGMGRRVEVRADKLQLFTDQQRRSVDAQLEFLAPSGR